MMLTVAWNPAWFHFVDLLPNGVMFYSVYFLSHIMDFLLAAVQSYQQHPFRELVIMRITLVSTRQIASLGSSRPN
jgi:hypothetical protein